MGAVKQFTKRAIRTVLGERAGGATIAKLGRLSSSVDYAVRAEGRRSMRELKRIRNVHRGERCFILGNGPSLGTMNLEPLRGEMTFGLNRGYLLFDKLGFSTTYLVSVNQLVIEQCAGDLERLSLPRFFSWQTRGYLSETDGITFLRTDSDPRFSTDVAKGLWKGGTVTYVALQLAYHMGFEEVILIGVDHSFATTGPPGKEVVSEGADPNHFDAGYFGKGFRWNLPDLEKSEHGYRLARAAFEAAGRHVIDATVGGKLTVFDKAPFESLVRPAARPEPATQAPEATPTEGA